MIGVRIGVQNCEPVDAEKTCFDYAFKLSLLLFMHQKESFLNTRFFFNTCIAFVMQILSLKN